MRARGRTAVLILATVALLAAAVFASAASAAPGGLLGLASARWSPPDKVACDEGATTADGVITVPIEVLRYRNWVEPIVDMCFDGKGPYPMALDTGAAASVITTHLARQLGLKPVGSPFPARGAGCTTTARAYGLESASIGGVELEGGDVAAVDPPWKGAKGPMGSLGADILSRFGSVKIDFRRGTLTLGAEEEGPRLRKVKDPPPVPAALLAQKPQLTVPMRVRLGRGVIQTVKVKVGSTKPQPWLVDTGTVASVIEPGVVKRAGLRATGTVHRSITYCSLITVPEYHAPSLSLGPGKLIPQVISSHQGAALGNAGILGSYSLAQFGSVVFDWPGAKLLLGVG
jgi:hypothetical protein